MRVGSFARRINSEFCGHSFTHDDTASRLQTSDGSAVLIRFPASIQNGAVFSWIIIGIENIFNPDGDTMQRAARRTARPDRISLLGLFASKIIIEMDPGVDFVFFFIDPANTGLDLFQ